MRPPRIPNLLPEEREAIYFLTICVQQRRSVLANETAWTTCLNVLRRLDRWNIMAAVAMPDHLHLILAPRTNRDESLSAFLKWFKRWFNESLPHHQWKWMEGGFDRLLRHDQSVTEKWEYTRQNPVRGGLVKRPEDWPYQFGFDVR